MSHLAMSHLLTNHLSTCQLILLEVEFNFPHLTKALVK